MMKENTVKVQVHMLPTDKASRIKYIPIGEYDEKIKDYIKSPKLLLVEKATEFGYGGVHLYFTSSEEIKEGDWVILFDGFGNIMSIPQQWLNIGVLNNGLRKIVATTNPELWIEHGNLTISQGRFDNTYPTEKLLIPKIPTSFLQPYIDAYNAGTPITEVLLEMTPEFIDDNADMELRLKLRADNSVIIHPVKERMYTRAELEQIIKAFDTDSSVGNFNGPDTRKKWFKINLS